MKEKLGPISVVGAGILWGIISPFVRQLSGAGLDSLQICLLRFILAAGIMLLCVLSWDKTALRVRLRDLWCFVGTGIISLAFFSWCYFTVIELSEVSVAVVLLYTAPIIVIALSALLFHERITPIKLFALLLTLLGTVLVAGLLGGSHSISLQVLLVGLGGGLGYALYSIFGRFAILRGYHSMTITLYTNLFAALGVLFLCKPLELGAKLNGGVLLWSLMIAGVSTVLPYLLYTYGLTKMESGKASILTTVEPMIGAVIGICFYRESHDLMKLLGMSCILAAVLVLNLGGIHRPHHAVNHHHHHWGNPLERFKKHPLDRDGESW